VPGFYDSIVLSDLGACEGGRFSEPYPGSALSVCLTGIGSMKFGHTLKSEEAACLAGHTIEFADHFVDYKGLKKLLKRQSKPVCLVLSGIVRALYLIDLPVVRTHQCAW
jgi:hypothetical protein